MSNIINKTSADILIVDDTLANLQLLANILKEDGYKVRPAIFTTVHFLKQVLQNSN